MSPFEGFQFRPNDPKMGISLGRICDIRVKHETINKATTWIVKIDAGQLKLPNRTGQHDLNNSCKLVKDDGWDGILEPKIGIYFLHMFQDPKRMHSCLSC